MPDTGARISSARLWSRLDRCRRLALVWAPAGYGKTALLAGWARPPGRRVLWVRGSRWREQLQPLLGTPDLPGGLQRLAPVTVVVDDCHQAGPDWTGLAAPGSTWVLAGRRRLGLPVTPDLVLGPDELALDEAEARAWAELWRPALGGAGWRRLYTVSEGWAQGYEYLLRAPPGEEGLRAAAAAIERYFEQETYAHWPPDLQRAARQLAAAPRLDPLSVAVLAGAEALAELQRQNAYLVSTGDGLRFHGLFRAFLLSRLQAACGPGFRRRLEAAARSSGQELVGKVLECYRVAGDGAGERRAWAALGALHAAAGDYAEAARSYGRAAGTAAPSPPALESPVPPLHVRLMGEVVVRRGGSVISNWGRPGVRRLFLYLALRAGEWVEKRELLADCFHQLAPGRAGPNFRVTLHALRRALEPELRAGTASAYIQHQEQRCRLSLGSGGTLDVEVFLRLLATARGARRAGQDEAALGRYRAALAQYRPLVPDEPGPAWLERTRARLASEHREALLELGQLARATGNHEEAAAALAEALELLPGEERVHRLLAAARSDQERTMRP